MQTVLNTTSKMLPSTFDYSNHTFRSTWDYVAALPIYIVLNVIDVWLCISLIFYGVNTGKWKKIQRKKSDNLNSGLVYTSVVVSSCLCFTHHLSVLLHYFNGFNKNTTKLCNIVGDFIRTVFALMIFAVNIFLWLRQRALYINIMSSAHFGKGLNVFSFSIIFMLIIGGLPGIILAALPYDSISSSSGCLYNPEGNYRSFSLYISGFFIVFSQISLICLYIYALLKLNGTKSISGCFKVFCNLKLGAHTDDNPIRRKASSNLHLETRKAVQRTVRKTAIFGLLSLASNIIVLILVLRLNKPYTRGDLSGILSCLAVFLNLLFMILSFVSWKEIITSPCRIKRLSFPSTPNTNTTKNNPVYNINVGSKK